MKNHKMISALAVLLFYLTSISSVVAQSSTDVRRVRIGLKTLVPNIGGLHAEYILPTADNRIGLAADFSRISLGGIANLITDGENIKAAYTYFSLGGNFYLGSSGRAKGPYFGLLYQHLGARTSYEEDGESLSGSASVNGLGLVFGLRSGGPFLVGLEIGAGRPLGKVRGSVVSNENGQYEVDSFEESFPIIPILNFTIGAAF